jgi:hypothetical protein
MQHKHLFVLTSPYSGSTLLVSLLGTSPQVSILQTNQNEGLKLPGLGQLITRQAGLSNELPWGYLRRLYLQHWDLSKPVLVEKGQFIKQAAAIERCFPGSYYLVMPRNPYAWCESMQRRRQPQLPPVNMERVATIWLRQCTWHIHNAETLERVLCFTYEDLCDNTDEVLGKLKAFMPELHPLDPDKKFKVHSMLGKKSSRITNTNQAAIGRLSPTEIGEITATLKPYPDVLDYFGYRLIEPPAGG